MTSGEIRATIEQLRKMPHECGTYTVRTPELRDRLIELLEQADPDKYMRLPVDADGVPIHIGDRMEDNERVARIVLTDDSCEPSVYLEKLPSVLHEYFCHEVHHYHKPTIEDLLREFGDEVQRCCDTEDTIAEYAAKLREVMADE